MTLKASRKAALEAGDRHYHTGEPCKNGHLAKRWTIDGSCAQCRVDVQAKERQAFRERLAANQ